MSFDAIHNYYREVEKLKHAGGTKNEKSIRICFQTLLTTYAKSKDLILVPEVAIRGRRAKDVYPDGTLKDILRQDWGYWESKDEYDDLELEIQKKFDKGYPNDNILFEDGVSAVLFQNGNEVSRIKVNNDTALDHILKTFIGFQRPEVAEFRKAIELFKNDVPKVTEALRNLIINVAEKEVSNTDTLVCINVAEKEVSNTDTLACKDSNMDTHLREKITDKGVCVTNLDTDKGVCVTNPYIIKRDAFLLLCREVINPNITKDDIREMVIQHILTADIFNTIFDESNFHRENNIARELQSLVETFFTKEIRETTLSGIKHYYDTINAKAAQIADHHEKQMFLKVVYETFYKSYDPKKADRLGVVYTPGEIVRFMIDSTDYLLGKYFDKQLEDKNVEILDPATGTGTFICDIIDHISKDKLPYKYKNELHANEVEILPYYIANLNIEFTYKQKMGHYSEFENLCFVDTLDNMAFDYKDKQDDIFSVSDENADRIKRQNEKKISVIIGNPPYNANQMNANENNKNREYPEIDKRIKDTYIKYSTAQKTKEYDMYSRFYRWAMDRIGDNGVICYITNNSYIDGKSKDGFRKVVQDEFQYAYVINLGGNIRELSGKDGIFLGEKHTIFGLAAMVGISIMWLVKDSKAEHKQCQIKYIHPTDIRATRDEKIGYLVSHKIKDFPFEHIHPDKDNNWINLSDNDWDALIDIKQIFNFNSLGVSTNRDEWVFDFDKLTLKNKMKYFVNKYNELLLKKDDKDESIKWSSSLKSRFSINRTLDYNSEAIVDYYSRPYIKTNYYADKPLSDRLTQNHYDMFKSNLSGINNVIAISGVSSTKPYSVLATSCIFSLDLLEKTQCLSLYRYDSDGNRHDNITDWALGEFRSQYKDDKITKEDIFHYVYGVLHNPAYRVKYEQNLKRSLPRIPYYEDFRRWADWGKALMDLHLNYETAEKYPLKREEYIIDESELYDHPVIPAKAGCHPELVEGQPVLKDIEDVVLPSGRSVLLDNDVSTLETCINAELHSNKESLCLRASVSLKSKPKLKADKHWNDIIIDEETTLSDIPAEAWEYKLGNRSALEWILDQYKEKRPRDPTIAKLFNTYRFADYKEKVIDLLLRVTTVSVETMKIVREMEKISVIEN